MPNPNHPNNPKSTDDILREMEEMSGNERKAESSSSGALKSLLGFFVKVVPDENEVEMEAPPIKTAAPQKPTPRTGPRVGDLVANEPPPQFTPPATVAPVTPPPAAAVPTEPPKVAEVPVAPAKPVAEQKQSAPPAPLDADLKAYVSKTSLRFIAEKTELSPASEKALDELAARLKSGGGRLQVTGHTCSLGPKSINQTISEKRALVVKEALVARGVAADRIETLGAADTQPVGNNKTVEGRVANRRVSFKLMQ